MSIGIIFAPQNFDNIFEEFIWWKNSFLLKKYSRKHIRWRALQQTVLDKTEALISSMKTLIETR